MPRYPGILEYVQDHADVQVIRGGGLTKQTTFLSGLRN